MKRKKKALKRVSTRPPNPGSGEAISLGCLCPILDNAHGHGAWGSHGLPDKDKVFVMSTACKLHRSDWQK